MLEFKVSKRASIWYIIIVISMHEWKVTSVSSSNPNYNLLSFETMNWNSSLVFLKNIDRLDTKKRNKKDNENFKKIRKWNQLWKTMATNFKENTRVEEGLKIFFFYYLWLKKAKNNQRTYISKYKIQNIYIWR